MARTSKVRRVAIRFCDYNQQAGKRNEMKRTIQEWLELGDYYSGIDPENTYICFPGKNAGESAAHCYAMAAEAESKV